jgi:hypothetical protein
MTSDEFEDELTSRLSRALVVYKRIATGQKPIDSPDALDLAESILWAKDVQFVYAVHAIREEVLGLIADNFIVTDTPRPQRPALAIKPFEEASANRAIISLPGTSVQLTFFGKIHHYTCDEACKPGHSRCGASGGNLTTGDEYVTCLNCLNGLRKDNEAAESSPVFQPSDAVGEIGAPYQQKGDAVATAENGSEA